MRNNRMAYKYNNKEMTEMIINMFFITKISQTIIKYLFSLLVCFNCSLSNFYLWH